MRRSSGVIRAMVTAAGLLLASASAHAALPNFGTLVYFHNNNLAHPTLDAGATLLATDGAGIDMIARNANGRVYALNLFPEGGAFGGNNADLYRLVANSLVVGASALSTAIPTLSEWSLLGLVALLAVFACGALRRRAS